MPQKQRKERPSEIAMRKSQPAAPPAESATTPRKFDQMTWGEFVTVKTTRSRSSQYTPFILALDPHQVYNATAAFPQVKTATLRGALYIQARKLRRVIGLVIRDDQLYAAYLGERSDKKEKG